MSIARRVAAVAALALLVGPLGATAATADDWADSQNGLWYYTVPNLETVHQTADGSGITIAVLDGPINPDVAELAGTNLVVDTDLGDLLPENACPATSTDPGAFHGTSMVSLILGTGASADPQLPTGVMGVAPGATVRYYPVTAPSVDVDPNGEKVDCTPRYALVGSLLQRVIDDGADIISTSVGLAGLIAPEDVLAAARAGVIIVAAAGNDHITVLGVPERFNGVVAVGSLGIDLTPSSFSNYGPQLGVLAPGEKILAARPEDGWTTHSLASGTSNSAPITAGIIALGWSAHPDATANQILQAVARTTGGTTHDLVRDDRSGFGMLNARQLVATDPTQFPDVNPFVTADGEPTIGQLAEAIAPTPPPTASASAEPSATATAAPAPDEGGLPPWLVPALGGGLLILVVGAVAAVLAARRRTPRTDPAGRT